MFDDLNAILVQAWPSQFEQGLDGAVNILIILVAVYYLIMPLYLVLQSKFTSAFLAGFLGVLAFIGNLYTINTVPFIENSMAVAYAYLTAACIFIPYALFFSLDVLKDIKNVRMTTAQK